MPRFKITPLTASMLAACMMAACGMLLWTPATQAADAPAAAQPRPALAVTTTTPQRATVPQRLTANGSVAAWQEASIGAQSNGLRLQEVRVNVGDVVKAGQVLATFDAQPVQAELAQARAAVLEAEASAAEAAANAERARGLQPSGALSQQQIQQYTTAAQTAKARLEAARAQLQVQQLRLKYTQVVAPDAGVVSARTATVGAVVAAGTELFRMVRQGRLEWRAEVTSADLARIRPGTKVQVAAASGATVEGQVRMLAPTVDAQTRNGLVYVDLPAHADIRAGMFARGDFVVGTHDTLTVPQSAVVVRDGFSHVFELVEGQRVAMRRVQTGQRQKDRIEVLQGLKPEAAVVERGGAFLNDGDLVRVSSAEKSEQKSASPRTGSASAATK